MKKLAIGVVIFLGVLFLALTILPVIFKDEIKQALDEQLAANLNADVQYDFDNFGVSIFSNFPNLTASIDDLGVINREPFAGQVLFAVNRFELEINLWKLITGSQLSLQGVNLDQPRIFIRVLEDGSANYDITFPSETEETTQAESTFNLAIEHWNIEEGHIIYDDATLPFYMELTNVTHSGSGNFSLSVFDLITQTEATVKKLSYDGDEYLVSRHIDMDLALNMDIDNMKFTFRDNTVSINDFAFKFDGWLAMPADDIDMDIQFSTQNNSFKSLISLIPAIYANDFEEIKTSGDVQFGGKIAGTYNEQSMPAYNVSLHVDDGMIQYPDLPRSINNVQLAMNIDCQDGIIDHTSVDISKFHLELGTEPIEGHFRVGNLLTYPIDMALIAQFNLANLTELVPMDGLDISGTLDADIKAVGAYDSINAIIPKIKASISLESGRLSYTDLPASINDINIRIEAENASGILNDTRVEVSDMTLRMDGQLITGKLLLDQFNDLHWQAGLEGSFDFGKLYPLIAKVYPMPGTNLNGSINTQFLSEGKLSDVEAERYMQLRTSGKADFDHFSYSDSLYLPQGMTIEQGSFSFDPEAIKVIGLTMLVGSSDFKLDGSLSNYLKFILADETVRGKLDLRSNKIDANEFMTESTQEGSPEEENVYSVIEIPKNIDFTFSSDIKEIIYDQLVLNDAKGSIVIRNGQLILDGLRTSTLGGSIVFDGSYDTRNIQKPAFAMALDVSKVAIEQTYSAFNTVRMLAPIAQNLQGEVSSKLKISGILQQDMMPAMATINGEGRIDIDDAALVNSKLAEGLTEYISKGKIQALAMKDISAMFSIRDGKLQVEPFDLKINDYVATIAGSNGLAGDLDYTLRLDVPAGQLGQKANEFIGSLTGSKNASENITLQLGVGGTYKNPNLTLLGSGDAIKEQVKGAVTEKAADLIGEKTGVDLPSSKAELNKEAVDKAREEADKLLAEAQKQADQVKAEAKKAADQLREEAKQQNEKMIKEAGSNPLKAKAAEIAGKKLIQTAEDKANKIEAEGNTQAETIMNNAHKKADALIKRAGG